MSISVQIYSNANGSSKTVTFNFVGEILAAKYPMYTDITNVASTEYFLKVTTSATQDNNAVYPVKIVRGLDELVLSKDGVGDPDSRQRISNTGADYANVKSMVMDYVYDYINGHIANQYNSGCSAQNPMKF